nr:hypothetical protein [Marinitoga lauensis]
MKKYPKKLLIKCKRFLDQIRKYTGSPGPSIGPESFEVREDVKNIYEKHLNFLMKSLKGKIKKNI